MTEYFFFVKTMLQIFHMPFLLLKNLKNDNDTHKQSLGIFQVECFSIFFNP